MGGIPRPRPGFLCNCDHYKVVNGKQIWANRNRTAFFTWDSLHGEIEAFDKKGRHNGSLNSLNGELIKEAVKGRTINV